MTTFMVALGLGVSLRWRHLVGLLPRRPAPTADPLAVAGLLSVGLHAGLSLRASLAATAEALGPSGEPIVRVLRESALLGAGHALGTSTGPLADLFRRLAESERTGAPLLGTLAAYEREQEAAAQALLVERARKLPVRLTIPLTLLILPGSMLALLGPTVLDLLGRAISP
ncbi:MAG: hypothetical protein HKN46_00880 [Acidimicrobiia bacterium]|nr:hypothetical protein [Acidimicrobiia bacterium]